ncbi:uncharacterized protein CMU_018420 [Cryptosporidium muris RN66]|uniref:GATA-type domain-containing protein n=1 Tax=Cryptosporidium muris (strain RN66) TaxID=441375 RepID=B6AD81_CRYMR|nr:uncharacterized protein CMU_018420 [Cryptosporidium muris RN66]EEA06085.1 hypothetical protein, conserved [Cryptosporidium muris RN66]|eukprot:XP_002140434.1 hypothetical protein [Cryptosporidium muris RN66]
MTEYQRTEYYVDKILSDKEIISGNFNEGTSNIALQMIPDSPPTMFVSANSSPIGHISLERNEDHVDKISTIFNRINEEVKDHNIKYLRNTDVNNLNNLLPPSLLNGAHETFIFKNSSLSNLESLFSIQPNIFASTIKPTYLNNLLNSCYYQMMVYNIYYNLGLCSSILSPYNLYTGYTGSVNPEPIISTSRDNTANVSTPNQCTLVPTQPQNNQQTSDNNRSLVSILAELGCKQEFNITTKPKVKCDTSPNNSLLDKVSTESHSSVWRYCDNNLDLKSYSKATIKGKQKNLVRTSSNKSSKKQCKSLSGGRRKIDKSSAVCTICGTTETSQWRFLNTSDIYKTHSMSNTNNLENSISQDTPFLDKQICCNACYMKYDRNRPRYRSGKKVPPPLPHYVYLYKQNMQENQVKEQSEVNLPDK